MMIMTDREIFKNNFANLLRKTKTKQIDVAKYAEVSYQTVSAWTKGRGYPRPETMQKLCRFFGVRQSELTDSHEKQETPEDILITAFRTLPVEGKEKLIERSQELLKLYPKKGRKPHGKTETKV